MRSIARLFIGVTLATTGANALVGNQSETQPAPIQSPSAETPAVFATTDGATTPAVSADEKAFADAERRWMECVQRARALHEEGDAARRAAGVDPVAFDREASCGAEPDPRAFGLAASPSEDDDDENDLAEDDLDDEDEDEDEDEDDEDDDEDDEDDEDDDD